MKETEDNAPQKSTRKKPLVGPSSAYSPLIPIRTVTFTSEINSEIVSARRVKALEIVEKERSLTMEEIASAGNSESLIRDVQARYKLLADTCAAQVSVAHLDQAATEAARIFESTVEAIEQAAAAPLPTSQPSPTYPKPNLLGPKPRHVVQVSSLLKKPFIESSEEVEEFLAKLRTELTNTIARGERVQIK